MNAPERLDTTALQNETKPLLVPATFKVTTPEQYQSAGTMLTGIKALLQKVDQTFAPHIKRAFDAHRALVAEKRTHEQPLLTAELTLKRGLLAYQSEQDRIRREQEAKAREEQEKERLKLEAQAAKLEAKGKTEQAEAKREAASVVPTRAVAVEPPPRIAGISTRETWTFEVTDESLIPREYLVRDDRKIGAVVRAMKSATNIPGIRAYADKGISSKAG